MHCVLKGKFSASSEGYHLKFQNVNRKFVSSYYFLLRAVNTRIANLSQAHYSLHIVC